VAAQKTAICYWLFSVFASPCRGAE
jgi:hypothetical protein